MAKGVASSLAASCMFGLMYYYATVLQPLTGIEIFGWRMLFTFPFLTLFMHILGYLHLVGEIFIRLRARCVLLLPLACSAFLLGLQLWLFMWAANNGKALEVSLGYLLMPLSMVICGRFVYKERLRSFQKAAVAFAAIGVANQVYHLGGLSWPTLVVAVGFPIYFMLRRALGTDHLGGLWFDMALMIPVAVMVLFQSQFSVIQLFEEHPRYFVQLPLLGIISACSIALFIIAGRLLPFSLFGLLSYVEPVLLVFVSLMLGEHIRPNDTITYACVASAIGILVMGGLRNLGISRTGRLL